MMYNKHSQHLSAVLKRHLFLIHLWVSRGWPPLGWAAHFQAVGLAGLRSSSRSKHVGSFWAQAEGQQLPRESCFHGERRRANTFLPSACVMSPNISLARASCMAKFKIKEQGGKLSFFVRGTAKLHGNGRSYRERWRSQAIIHCSILMFPQSGELQGCVLGCVGAVTEKETSLLCGCWASDPLLPICHPIVMIACSLHSRLPIMLFLILHCGIPCPNYCKSLGHPAVISVRVKGRKGWFLPFFCFLVSPGRVSGKYNFQTSLSRKRNKDLWRGGDGAACQCTFGYTWVMGTVGMRSSEHGGSGRPPRSPAAHDCTSPREPLPPLRGPPSWTLSAPARMIRNPC